MTRTRREAPPSSASEVVSDRMLVERAVANDPAAFGELVRRHSPIMRAYVYRIVGSMADTDDVVQDAFITAWRQLPSLRDPSAVRAWLMRIAGREAFTLLRRRPPQEPIGEIEPQIDPDAQPDARAVRGARLAALSAALDRLKEDQRQCWLLREIAECSYAEIAEQMNISQSTVRGLLARARASIAVQMEGWR